MVNRLLDAGTSKKLIDVYEIGKTYRYNGLAAIRPEKLFHDVENCGYHITFENGERIFFATDTGYIDSVVARDYEWYFIESNHTEEEIASRISKKQSCGEFSYEVRARKNHLSQEQALDWLARNAGPRSHYIFLHQHRDKEAKDGLDTP